jgi:type IV pilus assembly protein PilX
MKIFQDGAFTGKRRTFFHGFPVNQAGAALVISLFLLIAVTLLGVSAAQLALQGEKAARGDRDRQVALQAAESALLDAELDIEASPDGAKSRSHIFSRYSDQGFPAAGEGQCNAGQANPYLGLCRQGSPEKAPPWLQVDFSDQRSTSVRSVSYGHFTGQKLAIGQGTLPCKLPRYVIELMEYKLAGEDASKVSYFYRVTAIGFGVRETTQVVLQSIYRKERT